MGTHQASLPSIHWCANFEEKCLVQDRRFLHCLPTLKILYSIIALRKRMVDSIEEIPEWVKVENIEDFKRLHLLNKKLKKITIEERRIMQLRRLKDISTPTAVEEGDVLSNPINQRNCIGLSDQEIILMSTEEINKLLKKTGIDKDRQKELKQERRRLTQGDFLSNPINQRNGNGLSDQEIMMMSTEEINKLLKKMGVDKDRQKELRQERRRLTWLSRLRRLWMKFLFIFGLQQCIQPPVHLQQ